MRQKHGPKAIIVAFCHEKGAKLMLRAPKSFELIPKLLEQRRPCRIRTEVWCLNLAFIATSQINTEELRTTGT